VLQDALGQGGADSGQGLEQLQAGLVHVHQGLSVPPKNTPGGGLVSGQRQRLGQAGGEAPRQRRHEGQGGQTQGAVPVHLRALRESSSPVSAKRALNSSSIWSRAAPRALKALVLDWPKVKVRSTWAIAVSIWVRICSSTTLS